MLEKLSGRDITQFRLSSFAPSNRGEFDIAMPRQEQKQAARYATDETLENSLSPLNVIKGGLFMLIAAQVNKMLPPERIITLPL